VSTWLELLLLAIGSMFWPTLIVIVVVALRLEHPVKILSWFLAGGLLTTVTVGIVIVFALEGAISGSSQSSVDPAVDIVLGSLSLLGAYLLRRRENKKQPATSTAEAPPAREKKPSVAERAVGGGAAVAFAAGVLLNILPGTFPIVALKDIAELDASDPVKVVAIIVFYVIMFTFVEVPIVAYQFSPERTTAAMNESQAWLARNKLRVAAYVLAVVGVYLVVRGIIDATT
jgi:hypothetical protein